MNTGLLRALQSKYQGEMDMALANIEVYQINSVGIGEHSDIAEGLDIQVERFATAREKFDAVNQILSNNPQKTLVE